MRYFITLARYGAHLHGDEPGSVDKRHNVPGTRLAEPNPERVALKRQQMNQVPYLLYRQRRAMVLDALREFSFERGWSVFAAHVRTNHVRAVVEADVRPEKIMHAFKSYASRSLNRLGSMSRIERVGRAMAARSAPDPRPASREDCHPEGTLLIGGLVRRQVRPGVCSEVAP